MAGCSHRVVSLSSCWEAEGELGHCRDWLCHSVKSVQEFKCHQQDLLHLLRLEEFSLLGERQTTLWLLSGSSPYLARLVLRLQLNPLMSPNTSRVAGKARGRQLLSLSRFWPQALSPHGPPDSRPRLPAWFTVEPCQPTALLFQGLMAVEAAGHRIFTPPLSFLLEQG